MDIFGEMGWIMSDSQFTIVLGALRSIEEKMMMRCIGIDARVAKLEQRLEVAEKRLNEAARYIKKLEKQFA
jgi:hypothetical protein